jgi:uncharacterized protein (TIGR02996 family)
VLIISARLCRSKFALTDTVPDQHPPLSTRAAMTDEQAFLHHLLASPSDLTARLALADYLEERADPRGELLRLQHELTHEIVLPGRAAVEARQRALLEAGVSPVGPFLTLSLTSELGITFACIPPGTFLMGSPGTEKGRNPDSERRHRVTLTKGFFLGVYPVTQAEWEAVMGSNPSWFTRTRGGSGQVADIAEADLRWFPVECVSWNEAQDFCRKLAQRTGHRIRLPTEAEWEYACRGGTTTAFYFGPALDRSRANYSRHFSRDRPVPDPDLERPTRVGIYARAAPHPWGLCDMHGNVTEHCQDWLEPYAPLGATDPVCDFPPPVDRGVWRVERGGCFLYWDFRCRTASRHLGHCDHSIAGGFRVCFDLGGK